MPQRLTPLEVSILNQDTVRTPAHVGTVSVLEAQEKSDQAGFDHAGFDHAGLLALVAERIAYVPRYRQRVLAVPGRLAAPVWVDDARFDLAYHVRRAVLPGPGAWAQLEEFVARVMARRLDRSRALWELYLVEGLADGRSVVVGKTHLALVDNLDTVDLAQVLIDSMAQPVLAPSGSPTQPADGWLPLPEPTPVDLVGAALWESAQDPEAAANNLRGAVTSALGLGLALGEVLVGGPTGGSQLVEDLLGGAPRPTSPLAGAPSGQCSWASARLPLADITAVATAHLVTAHDVVLATVTGALRTWLLSRGELVGSDQALRVLAPVSVREAEGVLTSLGSEVTTQLVPLPIGTERPLDRLREVAAATVASRDVERAVGARELSAIPGFAPATLHILGARRAAEPACPPFDLLVTNVPGPQDALFLGPVPLVETYPVVPLPPGQLISIALTSYAGGVFCGVLADRVAVDDLTALTEGLVAALAELS